MNKEEYYLLYKDPKWTRCRAKILKRDKQHCTKCNIKTSLQVHHLYYIKNHNPWDYSPHCLITLCRGCHEDWHEKYQIMMFEDVGEINTKRKFRALYKGWRGPTPKKEKRQKIYVPPKSKKTRGFKVRNKLKDARKLY